MQQFYPKFKGLIPLIDRKQSAQPYVVSGKNFVVTAQGLASGLGRDLVAYKAIENPVNVQFFEISESIESFICTDEGIFRLDTESTRLVCLYKFTFRLDSQYPFTKAAVGNKFYFARDGYPLIEYNPSTESWQELSGGSIPDNIVACEESEGRLVVLTDLFVAWSAIGDGQDFVASEFTGAGAQALSKVGFANSTPIAIRKTSEGFLTFLSTGILRSQAIQSSVVYRHTVLSYEHVPLNPFCISTTVDQSTIFLTTNGLFSTRGQNPEPWQPLMSQFLREQIIPNLDLIVNQNNPQLFFDYDNSWFIVGISELQTPYVFTKGYILNIPMDEWGSIDANFVTLANIKILPLNFIGFSYGLVTPDGSIYIINNAKGVEYVPQLTGGLHYKKIQEEIPALINNDVLRFQSKFDWETIATSSMPFTGLYNRYGLREGFTEPPVIPQSEKPAVIVSDVLSFKVHTELNAGIVDIQTIKEPKYYETLDSEITVGPFRLTDEQVHDKYSYINGLILGMKAEAVGEVAEDWDSTIQFPVELHVDWMVATGDEDWGDSPVGSVQYDLSLIPTKDAYTPIPNDKTTLELVKYDGVSLIYSCYSNGIYHLLNLKALNPDDNFYLKTADININLGGRLL